MPAHPWPRQADRQRAEGLLSGGDGVPTFEVLLPIRPKGQKAPLFCMHPAGGLAWAYFGLVQHLDRPIYGLQARGFTGEEPLAPSVREMAADYVTQLRIATEYEPRPYTDDALFFTATLDRTGASPTAEGNWRP